MVPGVVGDTAICHENGMSNRFRDSVPPRFPLQCSLLPALLSYLSPHSLITNHRGFSSTQVECRKTELCENVSLSCDEVLAPLNIPVAMMKICVEAACRVSYSDTKSSIFISRKIQNLRRKETTS